MMLSVTAIPVLLLRWSSHEHKHPGVARTETPAYEMPDERRSNKAIGHRGEGQPDDDDDLEFLELDEFGDDANRDSGAYPTT